MTSLTAFYGPLHVYIRKEGGEFQAWIDPFAIIGTGRSEEAALRQARDLLVTHFKGLAELVRKHGVDKVRILSPMHPDEKAGASKVYLGGVHVKISHAGEGRQKAPPMRPDPIERIGRVLLRARNYSLDLLPTTAGT